MIFIESEIFNEQLNKLGRKYPKIEEYFNKFKEEFNIELGKNLGKDIYKFRIGNSSIPIGKRGGFRIILFLVINKNKIIPTIIYSKTEKETVNFKEIFDVLSKILEKL